MKPTLVTFLLFTVLSICSYGQKTVEVGSTKNIVQLKPLKEIQYSENVQKENQPKNNSIYPLTIVKRGNNPQYTITKQDRIKSLKNLLKALDNKESHLRSDPSLEAEAKANHWFENANKTRENVKVELKQLEGSN